MDPRFTEAAQLSEAQRFQNMEQATQKFVGTVEYPKDDLLFVDAPIHLYLFKFEYAICAHYCIQYEEAIYLNKELIDSSDAPESIKNSSRNNLKYSIQAMENYERWTKANSIVNQTPVSNNRRRKNRKKR